MLETSRLSLELQVADIVCLNARCECPPRLDAFEAYCWACGAAEGDYDSFIDKKARLALCEPHDSRFRCDLGLQWFCDLCLSGRAMMLTSEQ